MTTTPSLTVAILTPDDFSTIRGTVSRVASQSIARDIELLVLASSAPEVIPDRDLADRFHSVRVVQADLDPGTGHARAMAARVASSSVIVFAEDHCFPQPGWAEALLSAHRESWAAVGPVVHNANPGTLVSWADLLMGYGPWLAPGRSAERDHLPGHNSSYKVAVLLGLGEDLPSLMEAETALQWRLASRGHRLYQEASAQVAHTNFDNWRTWIPVTFHAGRVFAATRAIEWSAPRRFAFAAATPLVPFVRLWRHLRQAVEAGLPRALIARVTPVLTVGLIVDGAGQFIGCLTGAGHSRAILVKWDFHRNSPRSDLRTSRA